MLERDPPLSKVEATGFSFDFDRQLLFLEWMREQAHNLQIDDDRTQKGLHPPF